MTELPDSEAFAWIARDENLLPVGPAAIEQYGQQWSYRQIEEGFRLLRLAKKSHLPPLQAMCCFLSAFSVLFMAYECKEGDDRAYIEFAVSLTAHS